jgi:hypothetical protein
MHRPAGYTFDPRNIRRFDPSTTSEAVPFAVNITSPSPGALPGPLASITGHAPAGANVAVSVDSAPPVNVVADASGNWKWPVTVQPPAGSHSVVASIGDGIGPNRFSVGFVMPNVPSIPFAIIPLDVTSPISTIVGTAPAATPVSVVVDSAPAVLATADGGGNWSATLPSALRAGPHTIVATGTGIAAPVTANITVPQKMADGSDAPGTPAPAASGLAAVPKWVWAFGIGAVMFWLFGMKSTPQVVGSLSRHNPSGGRIRLSSHTKDALSMWYGGQGDPIYSLVSTGGGSEEMVERAMTNLRRTETGLITRIDAARRNGNRERQRDAEKLLRSLHVAINDLENDAAE